jgi:hypothetical protein
LAATADNRLAREHEEIWQNACIVTLLGAAGDGARVRHPHALVAAPRVSDVLAMADFCHFAIVDWCTGHDAQEFVMTRSGVHYSLESWRRKVLLRG